MKQTTIISLIIFVATYILAFIWFSWKLAIIICLIQGFVVFNSMKYIEK